MAGTQLGATFTAFVAALQAHSAAAAAAALSGAPAPWFIPPGVDDLSDPEAITPGFDRRDLSAAYETALTAPDGTVGGAAGLKLQLDILGAAERAFRLRHASSIRALYHDAARAAGHGHSRGPVAYNQQIAQDLLRAGGS